MIQAGTVFPSIDYAAHPAFRRFGPPATMHDGSVDESIRRADAALEEIHGSLEFMPAAEIERLYLTRVAPELETIAGICSKSLPQDHPVASAANFALDDARQELLKEALFQNDKKRYRPAGRVSPVAERIASDLAEDGLSLHRIERPTIQAIYDDLGQYRDRLTAESTQNAGRNCALALPRTGAYWNEISSFLHRAGIVSGCSHFRREPLELVYCALVLSHDGEQWWKGCYEDVGISAARTVYMHNDKDYDLMKLLVYLDEVDESRGPFCFIRGSHRWRRSRTQSFLFKGFDAASTALLVSREPVPTVYYRKAFRHPEFREQFLKLPRGLRGSSHFGDDILDDSELSAWLLKQETAVMSETANCMAFVGADGIHRGGCVREGQRWALQLGLRKVPPVRRRIERQAKAAYGFARSKLRGAVRRIVGDQGLETVRSLAQRVTGR